MRKASNAVPMARVKIEDDFWAPRRIINKEQTIPYQYEQLEKIGHIDSLKLNDPVKEGVDIHPFWDSDIAKWIEAASYTLATDYKQELDSLIDDVIDLLASNQHSDGYLNTYFTKVKPGERWTDLRDAHELYCAGHLIEAGVAHYEATGKRKLLDVVCRFANYIDTVFGPEEEKLKGYPGHQEIELALVKLYKTTNNQTYLKLSAFFINQRGQTPHYFEEEREKYGPGYFEDLFNTFPNLKEYNQSHKPVRKQDKVTGHSVRALYMYCAMADLAREMDDDSLKESCNYLWDNMTKKNMYITGGIGSTPIWEGFTFDYDLPNESAYAETCAAISSVFWNHRMLKLDCNGKYADAMERALYNGVISGISHDGKKFFYDNPLASLGDIHRQEWFGVACCPPNLARLLASLGEYIYSENDNEAIVHLYIGGSATFNLNNQKILLKQTTNYPWNGNVTFNLEMNKPNKFNLKLRIPGWSHRMKLTVNGEEISVVDNSVKGYINIEREWKNADVIELAFSMKPERIYSNQKVRQNRNNVALQRGPLVYCLEGTDNDYLLQTISLSRNSELEASHDDSYLEGIVKIIGSGKRAVDNGELYMDQPQRTENIKITAIPYYAWDNREPGAMAVWIPECL